MWCLIIQGTWEIKSAERTQHPPLSLLPVITPSYCFSFLLFPLTWELFKVYLLIYSVSAPCLHVCLSGTTHDKKKTSGDKHKIFSFTLLFSLPHSSTPNYVLTNQSTPANGRRGKKKRMKNHVLSAHIKERTVWKLLRS